MKTFTDIGIIVDESKGGNQKTLCPQCSSKRKNYTDPCLSVNADKETWLCHHCEWRGSLENRNGNRGEAEQKIEALCDYKDKSENLLYQSVRFAPKSFRQRRPDGNGGWIWNLKNVQRVPYRLPELIASTGPVYIPGGEKDVETLVKHGLTATTNAGGEGNWKPEFNEYLRGRDVVILEDNDEKGRKHGRVISESLQGIANQIKIIRFEELPKGGDVTDYLQINSLDDFKAKVKAAPLFGMVKEERKIIPHSVSSNDTELKGLMETTGVSGLSGNSEPDDVIEAIKRFSANTTNRDAVFLGVARSTLIKKLKEIGIQSPTKLVTDALKFSKSETVEGQGQTFSFANPEPWSDEVDGAELLEALSETNRRYLVLPKGADTALSLWEIFSWTHDAFQISPILDFRSPTKRCGKSTGLRVVKRLVPKPLIATNASTSSLFRGIEAFSPTLLIDEVDTFLNRDQETNGILNGGHEREGAFVLRCEGDNHEPRLFSVWCPKVLGGIGRRKDTLNDRSISILMKRKGPGQKVKKLPINGGDEFHVLRQKLARWSEDHLEELRYANPDIPESLNDRAKDNWFPLLAIADLVGGEWPKKAREAALILSGEDSSDEDAWGIQLLTDIRAYFKDQETDRVSSEDLATHLRTLEDRDWSEMGRSGKEITKRGISRILSPFDVKPKTIRLNSETTAKGYTNEMFNDAFFHYLPTTSAKNVTSVTNPKFKGLDGFQNVTSPKNVTDEEQDTLFKNNCVTDVTDQNGDIEEKNETVRFVEEEFL